MAEYKGSSGDGNRIRMLEKQREKEKDELNKKKEKFKEELKKQSTFSINEKFQSVSDNSSSTSTQFQSVGLISVDDFNKNIQKIENNNNVQLKKRLNENEKSSINKKKKIQQKSKLSFDVEDDEEQEQEEQEEQNNKEKKQEEIKNQIDNNVDDNNSNSNNNNNIDIDSNKDDNNNIENVNNNNNNVNSNGNNKKIKFFGKDPSVNTDFLPDIEREEEERLERERLAKEWLEQQEIIKAEEIEITYSYWDGSGHRRTLKCTKGTTIERFLEAARKEFKELRGVTVDHLMFIKEDIIIPHDHSFYDLIISKARGKSGPLFKFDVHEDIRLKNDATVEKDESHAAKMVEKGWYERNKHIFPASRWTELKIGGEQEYTKYTISDRLKK